MVEEAKGRGLDFREEQERQGGMKRKIPICITILLLLIILQSKNINKQIIKTFGQSEDVEIYSQAICPVYYMPHYDAHFIDVYLKSIYTGKYIYRIKVDDEKVEIGDEMIINSKLYKLGNKRLLEPVNCFKIEG